MPDSGGRALTMAQAMTLLADGQLEILQQIPWSSNLTFLVTAGTDDGALTAVYKPQRGERPLWDFASGSLCLREVAAFVVSEALGWELVPPTVLRDGPWGLGALQAFIPHNPDLHYLALEEPDPLTSRRIAAFDVVINNADRKGGHVLLAEDGALWAIDHGVAFHAEPKLRTVIWDFAGEPLPADVLSDLDSLTHQLRDPDGPLSTALHPLLSAVEVEAMRRRVVDLVTDGHFPDADPHRRAIPWPPI